MSALAIVALMDVVIQVAQPGELAPPPDPEPAPVVASKPATKPKRPDVFVAGEGGLGRGSLFGRAMTGPAGGGAIGMSLPTSFGAIEAGVDGEYDALSTSRGIGIHRFALGTTGGVRLWHLHLGAGLDVGSTWIARVSGSTASANELFVGFHGVATLDLFTIEGVTPFVQGRADVNTVMPTLSANAGLRFAF